MASYNATSPVAKKRALVIGNNDYRRKGKQLLSCVNDANAVSEALNDIGFIVSPYYNLANKDMAENFSKFRNSIQDGDLVLFYYSGHGYQVQGVNYLVPIDDENIIYDDDVENYGFGIDRLINQLSRMNPSNVTIAILDCCRVYCPERTSKKKGYSAKI